MAEHDRHRNSASTVDVESTAYQAAHVAHREIADGAHPAATARRVAALFGLSCESWRTYNLDAERTPKKTKHVLTIPDSAMDVRIVERHDDRFDSHVDVRGLGDVIDKWTFGEDPETVRDDVAPYVVPDDTEERLATDGGQPDAKLAEPPTYEDYEADEAGDPR